MGEFCMPSLGADMERGRIAQWLVAPGDTVHRGDVVAVIDTDKADVEAEIFEDGTVEALLVPVGTEVCVGTPLARVAPLGAEPADAPTAPTEPAGGTVVQPLPPVAPDAVVAPVAPAAPLAGERTPLVSPLVRKLAHERGVDLQHLTGTGHDGTITRADVEHAPVAVLPPVHTDARQRVSPRARRLAAEQGVDLASLRGTGPSGSVVAADLDRAPLSEAPSTAPPPQSPPIADAPRAELGRAVGSDRSDAMRAAIARAMARSKREIPHYYLGADIDFSAARAFLDVRNATRPVTERVLPVALLLKATALAVRETPELNGYWIDDQFRAADRVHIGVAISLRGGGLVAPAIHDTDTLSLDELMVALRDLAGRARRGSLRASEMSDPTITVTNLGDQGVQVVHGVIYPPQVALVGFGTIAERPWAVDGMIGARPVVTATLAADHRASDGARGARLLNLIDRKLQKADAL